MRSTFCGEAWARTGFGRAGATASAGSQAVSAGSTRVAIRPGASSEACTARAASAPTVSALVEVWIQAETGRAKPTRSDDKGAS